MVPARLQWEYTLHSFDSEWHTVTEKTYASGSLEPCIAYDDDQQTLHP